MSIKGRSYTRKLKAGPWEYGTLNRQTGGTTLTPLGEKPTEPEAWAAVEAWWRQPPERIMPRKRRRRVSNG